MDQTERPVKISKEFSIYAEKHRIYETFKRLLTSLVVKMPKDPLSFMLDFFQDLREAPKILVIGPRCSGKTALCRLISDKFGCELVNLETFNPDDLRTTEEQPLVKSSTGIPEIAIPEKEIMSNKNRKTEDEDNADEDDDDNDDEGDDLNTKVNESYVFVQSINNKQKEFWSKNDSWKARLERLEQMKKGWVLDGGISDKEKAMKLCNAGFFPTHTIILEAPTKVLVARAAVMIDQPKSDEYDGSKIVIKGDPRNPKEVQKLLNELTEEIEEFCHQKTILTETFKYSVKTFNSDQPLHDLYKKVLSFLCQPRRCIIPFTPRILLLSPPGTCVDDVAMTLANKYNINLVSYEEAKENEIMKKTKLGEIFSLCQQTCSPDPDEVMFDLVDQQLNAIEVDSRGWLVTGFPSNIDQCEFFYAAGYEPNRVFFLEMDDNKIFENFKKTLGNGAEDDPLNDRNFHKRGILSKDELCYKLTNYRLHEAEIKNFYREMSFEVDSSMSPDNLVQCLEAVVVNPLPICHDDDDNEIKDQNDESSDNATNNNVVNNNNRVKKISINRKPLNDDDKYVDSWEKERVCVKDNSTSIKGENNLSNSDNFLRSENLISNINNETTRSEVDHNGFNRDSNNNNNNDFLKFNNDDDDGNMKKADGDDGEDGYKKTNEEEKYDTGSDNGDNENADGGNSDGDGNDDIMKNDEVNYNMNENEDNEFLIYNNEKKEEDDKDDEESNDNDGDDDEDDDISNYDFNEDADNGNDDDGDDTYRSKNFNIE